VSEFDDLIEKVWIEFLVRSRMGSAQILFEGRAE